VSSITQHINVPLSAENSTGHKGFCEKVIFVLVLRSSFSELSGRFFCQKMWQSYWLILW